MWLRTKVKVNHFTKNYGRQVTFKEGNDGTTIQGCCQKYMGAVSLFIRQKKKVTKKEENLNTL